MMIFLPFNNLTDDDFLDLININQTNFSVNNALNLNELNSMIFDQFDFHDSDNVLSETMDTGSDYFSDFSHYHKIPSIIYQMNLDHFPLV